LTPVVEKEQIATRADLKLCQEAKTAERPEHHDQKLDQPIHHSEKALKVSTVAMGVASTIAGLAKVAIVK
jgi:hypothetical protein